MVRVFVNGSFDVLHTGHLDLLNYARTLGDHLLVAIDSDRRISEKKGHDRPLNPQHIRYAVMSNLKAVDGVKIFDTDTGLIDIISAYKPHVMVVGSDWRGKPIIGGQYADRIEYYSRVNDESTTKTLENFISRRQLPR